MLSARKTITGLFCWVAIAGPAAAQTALPPELRNSRISVVFEAPPPDLPRNIVQRLEREGRAAKDLLVQSQVLKRLAAFVSPFRWTRPMTLRAKYCGDSNLYFEDHDSSIPPNTPESTNSALVVCYEFVTEQLSKSSTQRGGFTGPEYVAGAIASAALHELGHAAFDHFKVPVLGREEDAADEFASYMILQFGPELAVPTLKMQALLSAGLGTDWTFRDEHGTAAQRYFNSLCIAYGSNPVRFGDIARTGRLYQRISAAHQGIQ
jgi:hypothetical protein